jgi:basic membrane lipoprotein Med (substrate-binding protein (PBP1-ABC) superfamily)/DNA-binding SARP family transcriptional activator
MQRRNTVEVRILGPLEIDGQHGQIDIGPRKQRSLLALLAINANRVIATERILEALWGNDALGKERALWVHISRLRATLSEIHPEGDGHRVLVTRDRGYALEIDDTAIDAYRFEKLVSEIQGRVRDDPTAAAEQLRSALDMWRGDVLEDFRYEDFASNEITRLQALRQSAIEDRIEADLCRGLAGELITELEVLRRDHPANERLVGQQMLALYRSGRASDALRCYSRFRRHLGEEFGLDPSPELNHLEEQILLHDRRLRPATGATGAPVDVLDLSQDGLDEASQAIGPNPFRGLRPFGEEDAADFFGREELVAEIVRRLGHRHGLVAVVGPSGCGKSSAVRAGVIPAVREGALGDPDDWLVALMVPGSDPFAELEAALLRAAVDPPTSLTDQLIDEQTGTLRAAMRILPDESSKLLLVIDQFEELFVLVQDEERRRRFLDSLLHALDDPHGRVKIICTLRADFYDRPLAYHDVGQRMTEGLINVVAMAPHELEAAIEAPAAAAGVPTESALRVALVSDVLGRPGTLPLLQYTMTELFDRRHGPAMTLDDYRGLDGLHGALRVRADDLYDEFDPDEQLAVRQLFLRLVTIADDDEWVRRRVPAAEMLAIDVEAETLQSVIATFTTHRLLTTDRDHITGSPTVEVAHESLLVEWPRLRGWIDEARDDVTRQATLAAAVREWQAAGRDAGYLLTGTRLADYVEWSKTSDMLLTAPGLDFLAESEAAETRAALEERTERSDERRNRRLGVLMAAIIGAAVTLGAVLVATLSTQDGPTVALIGRPNREPGSMEAQIRNGFEQAGRERDFVAEELEPLNDAGAEFAALLATDPDLVITNSAFLSEQLINIERVAANNPATIFAVIGDSDAAGPNVLPVEFADEEAAFLAGAAAALESRSGVIGFIGADPLAVDGFRAAYEAGARHVRPEVSVLSAYLVAEALAVWDGDLAAEAAARLFDRDADVVFTVAGEGGRAVPAVAAEHSRRSGRHRWAIGIDVDEWLLAEGIARDHVLTSAIRRLDVAAQAVIERYDEDQETTEPVVLDAANGGVSYSQSGDHLASTTVEILEQLRIAFEGDDIDVPSLPVTAPTDQPAPDELIEVTIDRGRCQATAPAGSALGGILQIDVTNLGTEPAGIEIHKVADGTTGVDLTGPLGSRIVGITSPSSQAVVAPGGTHAISARLNQNGTWAVLCVLNSGDEPALGTLVEVVAPTPPTDGPASLITYDGERCRYDGKLRFSVGQSINFTLANSSAREAGLSVWRVSDGTTLDDVDGLDALSRASLYIAGSVPDVPAGGTDGFVLNALEAGTYVANCFELGNATADRPGAVFTVETN